MTGILVILAVSLCRIVYFFVFRVRKKCQMSSIHNKIWDTESLMPAHYFIINSIE